MLSAVLSEDAWPMRLFGGKGLISDGDRAWYDVGDSWVVLVSQRRRRYVESAVLETGVLDAGVPGTVWHRLLLDARIPPGCRVSAQSRSADEVDDLDRAPWRDEPAFGYQRTQGSELAFEADEVTAAGWATWEVLLQHGVGRHLQLRIELSGDVRDTPWLRALRVYYPRFSYVDRYLPAVYQADDESASFLTRFLANTEGILTDIEGRIVAAQALLDPRTAPESALGWLFGWFDLAADPTWDAARRRLFLRHATAFLGLRGTELGIVTALRLALDDCLDDSLFGPLRTGPGGYRIVERFATRKAPVPGDVLAPDRTLGEQRSRWDPSQGRDDLVARWRAETGDAAAELPALGRRPAVGELRGAGARRRTAGAGHGRGVAGVPAAAPRPHRGSQRRLRPGRADDVPLLRGDRRPAVAARGRRSAGGLVPLRGRRRPRTTRCPPSFTVLLPVRRASGTDADAQRRRAIATRVVELQKPAHTTFGIRFFWSAFQVGSAVLGQDTQVEPAAATRSSTVPRCSASTTPGRAAWPVRPRRRVATSDETRSATEVETTRSDDDIRDASGGPAGRRAARHDEACELHARHGARGPTSSRSTPTCAAAIAGSRATPSATGRSGVWTSASTWTSTGSAGQRRPGAATPRADSSSASRPPNAPSLNDWLVANEARSSSGSRAVTLAGLASPPSSPPSRPASSPPSSPPVSADGDGVRRALLSGVLHRQPADSRRTVPHRGHAHGAVADQGRLPTRAAGRSAAARRGAHDPRGRDLAAADPGRGRAGFGRGRARRRAAPGGRSTA